MPGHTKCCTCHAKSSQQTWRSDAPKCNPSQEITARTSQQLWWRCLLYCACHGKCIFADPLQRSHACHRFWKCCKILTFLLTLEKVHNPLRLPGKSTSEPPKVARTSGALYILTSKCASRHNGVHLFDISTSKSGPSMVCFVGFDFEMCFAPQRRALFRHRNFQKWSEPAVFCRFLTSKCASRHNCVQFFISHLASWLRTQPSGATNHRKNTVFRDFPTFSRTWIFFLLIPSLLWSSLFYSSLLCDSSRLCFSSVHIVGSLTSKLPSVNFWLMR